MGYQIVCIEEVTQGLPCTDMEQLVFTSIHTETQRDAEAADIPQSLHEHLCGWHINSGSIW